MSNQIVKVIHTAKSNTQIDTRIASKKEDINRKRNRAFCAVNGKETSVKLDAVDELNKVKSALTMVTNKLTEFYEAGIKSPSDVLNLVQTTENQKIEIKRLQCQVAVLDTTNKSKTRLHDQIIKLKDEHSSYELLIQEATFRREYELVNEASTEIVQIEKQLTVLQTKYNAL